MAYTNALRIGYARVSGRAQDHQLQFDALAEADCRDVVVETASTRCDRPKLRATLDRLQPGDTLVIYKPDRVARSMKELLVLLEDELHARQVNLEILSGICAGLHKRTGATIADKMLFLVAAMAAEMERDLIHERTMDGLAAAAAQGRRGGRPRAIDPDTLALALSRKQRGESITTIAAHLGTGRPTLYRTLQQHEQANAAPTISSTAGQRVSLACPTCGHEPDSRPEARCQREDLATVWLHLDGDHVREQRHCAACQPHSSDVLVLECARCGDGPLVTGPPASTGDQRPPAMTAWLADHRWHTTPELLCPPPGALTRADVARLRLVTASSPTPRHTRHLPLKIRCSEDHNRRIVRVGITLPCLPRRRAPRHAALPAACRPQVVPVPPAHLAARPPRRGPHW